VPRKHDATPVDDLREWILRPHNIGVYLGRARVALKWSLRELELASGVGHTEIYKIENDLQECRVPTFIRLAAALGIPWGRVFDDLGESNVGVFYRALTADRDFQALVDRVSPNGYAGGPDVAMCLHGILAFAAQLVRCASAERTARRASYPSQATRDAFIRYAQQVDAVESLVQRLSIKDQFLKRPIEGLTERGLLFEDLLRSYVRNRALPKKQRQAGVGLWLPGEDIRRFPSFAGDTTEIDPAKSKFKLYYAEHLPDKSRVPADSSLRWPKLRERVASLTDVWGARSQLAAFLGKSKQVVNGWLSGATAPDADTTLRLLEWVTAEEAKLKSPGSVSAPPERVAPKAKKPHEEASKSEPGPGSQKRKSNTSRK
jgi:transcriptional regulator with XRE-family HTH domain